MPVTYADTSSYPSDVPRHTNPEFILHQQRMSSILSELERTGPFDSDLLEISRAKSIAWAHDHMQVLEQFKMLSWSIHEAERKQEGMFSIVDFRYPVDCAWQPLQCERMN